MRKANPAWKVAMAILSLCLTVLVWQQGLQDSFRRPSVAPRLALAQQEMAFMSEDAMPESLEPFFLSSDPENSLRMILREIPIEKMQERQKIVLAAIEKSQEQRDLLLSGEFEDKTLASLKYALLGSSTRAKNTSEELINLKSFDLDPLLFRVSCIALGGDPDFCIEKNISRSVAFRLLFSQGLPVFASFIGVILLMRQCWIFLSKKKNNWPDLTLLPLSILDMILLVAGGFVVLGEVLLPTLFVPLIEYFSSGFSGATSESLKVFLGYISMTLAPLFILKQQLKSLPSLEMPEDGWLQWRLRPFYKNILMAFNGWLMIMPLVLFISWIMNILVGDQGGSNPLLELVLTSNETTSLFLLVLTTVVFAPFFEELIFRGVLLPVLVNNFGRFGGVILTALFFALAHLSVGELPPLFVLGIGLSLLRLSSGRLFPCAIMHSLWNGITFANLLFLRI